MTDTRDPRYVRMGGLILLSALLVVVSCEVERPTTTAVDAMPSEADPPAAQAELPANEEDPSAVQEEPPASQAEPVAEQAGDVEALEAEVRALIEADRRALREFVADPPGDLAPSQAEPQEISPENRAAVQVGPVFTPMTVRPEIRNRQEVVAALMQEYPADLRDAGIGGTVVVWFFVTEEGTVPDTRVSRSSGRVQLDQAAVRVAAVLRFTPAMNGTEAVAVWIEVPITFQVR